MKQYFNKIHYSGRKSIQDIILGNFLEIFSLPYLLGICIRNYLFKIDVFKTEKLQACVISVGNLTTGGTGKTPLTAEIARYIKTKYNKKIAILSRGYGGQLSGDLSNMISDGEKIYLSAEMAGDEPYWMAANIKGVSVITGKNRVNSGNYAIDNLDAEVLILDDGFQHIKLKRDLNILVVDLDKKFGNGKLLPAGPLRETLESVQRADHIVFIDKNSNNDGITTEQWHFIEKITNKYNKPYSIGRFKNAGIYNIKTSEEIDATMKHICVFTGIAQPESFLSNLKALGYIIKCVRLFPDHHLYSSEDFENIMEEASDKDVECIITTEKDSVKLTPYLDRTEIKVPVYVQKIAIDIDLKKIIDQDKLK